MLDLLNAIMLAAEHPQTLAEFEDELCTLSKTRSLHATITQLANRWNRAARIEREEEDEREAALPKDAGHPAYECLMKLNRTAFEALYGPEFFEDSRAVKTEKFYVMLAGFANGCRGAAEERLRVLDLVVEAEEEAKEFDLGSKEVGKGTSGARK